jgi:hypothetical protein
MLDLLLFSVGPLSAFNFQAREQPPFERVCWRLTGYGSITAVLDAATNPRSGH